MLQKMSVKRVTLLVATIYACLILYSCATNEKEKCLRWSTIEITQTQCTLPPYRMCVDEVTDRIVCIDKEKEN